MVMDADFPQNCVKTGLSNNARFYRNVALCDNPIIAQVVQVLVYYAVIIEDILGRLELHRLQYHWYLFYMKLTIKVYKWLTIIYCG